MPFRQYDSTALLTLGGLQLTEHNRSALSIDPVRIGVDKRTMRGELRRQHIDVKHEFSVSWADVPHRAAYTVDRKAGGQDMKDFFDVNHAEQGLVVTHLGNTEAFTVLVESFSYSIKKRWDFEVWDCSLDLVEV